MSQLTIKDATGLTSFIKVSLLCQAFLDHRYFQRLRWIKQLGTVSFVYPGATHTRFEHSLGVMHLAGEVIDTLRQQGHDISQRQKDLVQLAALYHDIGHLAFSHLFDEVLHEQGVGEAHEVRSCQLLRAANAELKLLSLFEVEQVEAMITGRNENDIFLYSIVCDKITGVDVDRIAYLQQDAYHCCLPGFQHQYLLGHVSINDKKQLQFHPKTQPDIQRLFEFRNYMFRTVYRHRTVRRYEALLSPVLRHIVTQLSDKWSMEVWLELDDTNIMAMMRAQLPKVYAQMLSRDLPEITREDHAQWLTTHASFFNQANHIDQVRFGVDAREKRD